MSVYTASLQREMQVEVSERPVSVVYRYVVHVVHIIAPSRENDHGKNWKNCCHRLIYGYPAGLNEDISVNMVMCTCKIV